MEEFKVKDLIASPELRLKLYEKALEDYRKSHFECGRGFCKYFNFRHHIDVYAKVDFEKILPELYNQKPEKMYDEDGWWFIPGVKSSRIKCLENAIKMIQDEKEKENNLQ